VTQIEDRFRDMRSAYDRTRARRRRAFRVLDYLVHVLLCGWIGWVSALVEIPWYLWIPVTFAVCSLPTKWDFLSKEEP
jgi:hypothetical protein